MEFVSQSSFWSFNHVFQFNGAEAALVLPCLNVRLLFLFHASIHTKKAGNCTCGILEMQLLTPRWGPVQLRHLLLSALALLEPAGFPAHQTTLPLAPQLSLLQPQQEIARGGRSRTGIQHLSSTQGLCVSVSLRIEDGFCFFKQFVLQKEPQNCSNVQFLILDHIASKLPWFNNSRIKNLSSVSYNLPDFNNFG